jgi:hypothetical protein
MMVDMTTTVRVHRRGVGIVRVWQPEGSDKWFFWDTRGLLRGFMSKSDAMRKAREFGAVGDVAW